MILVTFDKLMVVLFPLVSLLPSVSPLSTELEVTVPAGEMASVVVPVVGEV